MLKDFKERQVLGEETPWSCWGKPVLVAGQRPCPCACSCQAARPGSPAFAPASVLQENLEILEGSQRAEAKMFASMCWISANQKFSNFT